MHVTIGEVVSDRFFMGYAPRSEHTVGRVYVPVKTDLGIEEIIFLMNVENLHSVGVIVEVVAAAGDLVVDMAVLQVTESRKSGSDRNIGTGIDIAVELFAKIAIILLQGINRADIVAHPGDLAEVMAAEIVQSAAEDSQDPTVIVRQREHTAPETVVIFFQADEVAFLDLLAVNVERLESIFGKSAACLILVIVSVVLGVVQADIEIHAVRQRLREEQVEMMLDVVVGLIVVECRRAVACSVFAAGVVTAAVLGHLLFRCVIPGHIGLLLAAERKQAD